jgi:predicted TIM-barrel fold metal-dependent hydrolase
MSLILTRRAVVGGLAAAAAAPLLVVSQTAPKRVDTHAHIFKRGLPLAPGARYTSDYDAPVEDYLKQLDANGMTHGVLVQISFLGTDNSYILDGIKQANGRLRGIAVVSPEISMDEMKAMDAAGIVGVRLNLVGRPIPNFTEGPWPEHLKRVAALGWQVEVHREAKDIPAIVGPLLAAGVNVVVDHFGRFDGVQGLDDPGFRWLLTQGASKRMWVKISAAYRNGKDGAGEAVAVTAYPLLRDAIGLDRLLFGSDWPHTTFEKSVTNEAERRQIMGENAAKLFRI